MNAIRELHTSLLARPFKHKCTKRFYPELADKVYFRYIKHPVEPIHNKRLDMLAVANRFRTSSKYMEMEEPSTCVPRSVLEANCTVRVDHLARPMVRVLKAVMKERAHFGKDFLQFISDRIAMSLDTIYYHNVKSLMNIAAAKKKNRARFSKSLAKRPRTWDEMGDKERLLLMATPKTFFPPTPPPPRKRKKLEQLKPGIDKLSVPLQIYKRPSQDSLILRLRINPLALTYTPTDRINKLGEIPAWRMVKPWVPVSVKRSALLYQLTERTTALSVPAPRARAVDSDLKENPYDISPFALKYKATPRIIELAKPVDR